ncbi:MAG TPA: hypothetical protein VFV99_30360 [Kofleriaceae bacterium]|nr:hypothetical protein [Kofleriaceae bacterium]
MAGNPGAAATCSLVPLSSSSSTVAVVAGSSLEIDSAQSRGRGICRGEQIRFRVVRITDAPRGECDLHFAHDLGVEADQMLFLAQLGDIGDGPDQLADVATGFDDRRHRHLADLLAGRIVGSFFPAHRASLGNRLPVLLHHHRSRWFRKDFVHTQTDDLVLGQPGRLGERAVDVDEPEPVAFHPQVKDDVVDVRVDQRLDAVADVSAAACHAES